MASNILLQVQVGKSAMLIFVSHSSLQIYLSKIGMMNKYNKHKEFIAYNLSQVILSYIYNFVDQVQIINIEYNVKQSSFTGMFNQIFICYLDHSIMLPLQLYSLDKRNHLFLMIASDQYLSLPILNRVVSNQPININSNKHNLLLSLKSETVLIKKQYKKSFCRLEIKMSSQIHRIFIETNGLCALLNNFFDVTNIVHNSQLLSLLINQLLTEYLVIDTYFLKILNCSIQVLPKNVRLNQFELLIDKTKVKIFALAHDNKIVDKFNKLINQSNQYRYLGLESQEQRMLLDDNLKVQFPVVSYQVSLLATELSTINTNTILLLGISAQQETNYAVHLGEQIITCKLTNQELLEVNQIC